MIVELSLEEVAQACREYISRHYGINSPSDKPVIFRDHNGRGMGYLCATLMEISREPADPSTPYRD